MKLTYQNTHAFYTRVGEIVLGSEIQEGDYFVYSHDVDCIYQRLHGNAYRYKGIHDHEWVYSIYTNWSTDKTKVTIVDPIL